MASAPSARLRDDVARLARRGLGVREFSLAAAGALRRSVPFDGVCLVTDDPATLLPTGEVVDNGLPAAATERLTEIEMLEADFLKFSELSRSVGPVRTPSMLEVCERRAVRSIPESWVDGRARARCRPHVL